MTESKKYPIPTNEQEDVEEALGVIWSRFETGEKELSRIAPAVDQTVGAGYFEKLKSMRLVREDGAAVALTPEGEKLAKDITRRHRLAERLLTDVLSLDKQAVDPNACQLEHILSPEVSNSICTLLGHPQECPHGSAIPPGDCCRVDESRLSPIVVSLNHLKDGDDGRIAYVLLQNHPELHKLLSLGVVPGTQLHVHQTFPTYVIEIGESQLALEESIAKNIYIRKN